MNCLGLANYVTRCRKQLMYRSTLINLITVTDRITLPESIKITKLEEEDTYLFSGNTDILTKEVGTVVQDPKDNAVYIIDNNPSTNGGHLAYRVHDQPDTPIMDIYDEFYLNKGMIDNYLSDQPVLTTYGLFILNVFIFEDPFGNLIPYLNDQFNYKKIQSEVARLILQGKINRAMHDKFLNNIYFIGCFTELSVPSFTMKSMTTSPEIIKRRDELFAKYKDQLQDPLIVAKIEDELIAMDKKYLSTDPAFGWIVDSKEYDVSRKKMFITNGVTEAFSDDTNEFTFIPEALNEKMNFEHFSVIANEIRRGSYMRGKETAKGGEETKYVLRIFQNVAIDQEDCGTRDGILVTLQMNDLLAYEGTHVLLPNGKEDIITPDTIGKYIDKPILIRSPMKCLSKTGGFCYACFGERYKRLNLKSVGMKVVEATGILMNTAMKAMHVSKVETIRLDNLDDFVI